MKSVLGRGISVFGESSCFLFAHELSCHMKLLFCMYAGIHRKQFCMALNSYKFVYDVKKVLMGGWINCKPEQNMVKKLSTSDLAHVII